MIFAANIVSTSQYYIRSYKGCSSVARITCVIPKYINIIKLGIQEPHRVIWKNMVVLYKHSSINTFFYKKLSYISPLFQFLMNVLTQITPLLEFWINSVDVEPLFSFSNGKIIIYFNFLISWLQHDSNYYNLCIIHISLKNILNKNLNRSITKEKISIAIASNLFVHHFFLYNIHIL